MPNKANKKVVVTEAKALTEAEKATLASLQARARANRPAPTRYGNTIVAVNPAPAGEDNLPKQARVILNALRAFKKPVAVNQLVDGLVKAGLETRQEPYRIYTFYRARLVTEGRIKLS